MHDTPAPIRHLLEPAGISSLMWAPNFRGEIGYGRKRRIWEIVKFGL
jgi:hypothetical protein